VLDIVAVPIEQERLRHLAAAAPGTCWDRLLFSAKESLYKAWFPLTGRWLDFQDVGISIDAAGGTFDARPLTTAAQAAGVPLTAFAGRWLASGGLILTAVTMAGPASAAAPVRYERPGRG
jgi:4'-phosphopantetheinyl transferase EntD